jgi:CRP/FNR family transcriptional regulator
VTSGVLGDPAVRSAMAASVFAELDDRLLAALVVDATLLEIPAGALFIPPGAPPPSVYLLVRGFGRAFLASPTGRQTTIRYIRPGEVIGAASLFTTREAIATGQCIVDSALLRFSGPVIQSLVTTEVRVANAFNREMSLRLLAYFRELEETSFGTARQRLARHLLHVAAERQRGRELVVELTQQQLADAIGSVREVVARIVGELRRDGLVRSDPKGIVIVDAAALEAEGWSAET